MKATNGARLERVNIMLERSESEWLDMLVDNVRANGGCVSRSEIVRAAIAGFRELAKLAPECPAKFMALERCRCGGDLIVMSVLAARYATDSRLHTSTTVPRETRQERSQAS
jgi:hypothetical protein